MLVWLIGSDKLPLTEQEQTYRDILASEDPTRPVLISAAKRESKISGPSGVKMNGPYDYVPPFYWYADTASGGAFGFNTETGPGPQVPLAESLEKMFSKNHLWPIDDIWMFHTSLNEFHGLKRYNAAMVFIKFSCRVHSVMDSFLCQSAYRRRRTFWCRSAAR